LVKTSGRRPEFVEEVEYFSLSDIIPWIGGTIGLALRGFIFTVCRYCGIVIIEGVGSNSFHLVSVTYIANNSRTQRPSVPKFGRKVPHLRCDSQTSFKVKRSKVRVTVHRIFQMARPTNFKFGKWMEDDDPHQPQVP